MRAEDAMQEAFAKLWEIRERVPVEKGLGYLLTVTRRYLVDCIRHDKVVDNSRGELMYMTANSATPTDGGMGDEMFIALSKLPEIQRSIMQLRDIEGYGYREIAQMLDISEDKVQVYLFRARTTMKKLLCSTLLSGNK